jgi:hypothetical protein
MLIFLQYKKSKYMYMYMYNVNISEIRWKLCVQFVISWIAILFLNGAKCENDTRTLIVDLILI